MFLHVAINFWKFPLFVGRCYTSTLFVVFAISYYLELRKAINILLHLHSFTDKGRIGWLDISEHGFFLKLGKTLHEQ